MIALLDEEMGGRLDAVPSDAVFVSPHLDDAVLSCGHLLTTLAEPTVLTVFAGAPRRSIDGWNAATTGQRLCTAAVRRRRREDRAALALVGARGRWLSEHEHEFRTGPLNESALERRLDAALAGAVVVAPLGLVHPDHLAVSDACVRLAMAGRISLVLWLDQPYATARPEVVDRRLRDLRRRDVALHAVPEVTSTRSRKVEAVMAYTSQVPALRRDFAGFDESLVAAEAYWSVEGRRDH